MKTSLLKVSAFILGSLTSLTATAPTGFIDSSSNFIRANTNVELNWKINIPPPETIETIVTISPEEDIVSTVNLIAEVRVLGAAMGSFWSPMYGEAFANTRGTEEQQIFAGWANGIGAGASETFEVPAGKSLDFTFRTWNRSSPWRPSENWGSMRTPVTTGTSDERLFILRNGDEAPSYSGAFDQASSEAFVAPYLADDGKTIKIGPNDLLIFAELNEEVDSRSDFQDFVVLVSFRKP